MSDPSSILTYDHIRVSHPIIITYLLFSTVFRGNVVYYTTVFIGHVRFTITDDSSVVFKTGSEEDSGRICCIFLVDDGEPTLYVELASNMTNVNNV